MGKRGIRALLVAGTLAQASIACAEPIRYSGQNYLFAWLDVPSIAALIRPDTFVARRDGAKITIILDASTPHYDEQEADCQGGQLTYKLDRPTTFAYSCRIGDDIVYTIAKYGKTYRVGASNAREQIGYSIRYPALQKDYWDSVVEHMTRTLRFAR